MSRAILSLLISTVVSAAACTAMAQEKPSPTAQEKPSPAEIKKHETTPGGKYEPGLDVLQKAPMEQPGAKPGVPTLSAEEFQHANRIYFQRCAGLSWRAAQWSDR
jgi:nitrite reductase (NO-forming)/hydroxylamine reductase